MSKAENGSPVILVTGADGQVGSELRRSLATLGRVIALTHVQADLTLPEQLRAVVRSVQPNVVVNAAGYTAVDQAETDVDVSRAVNATAPGVLAEEADALGALLVHYSTDYVFDGGKIGAYVEQDAVNPLSEYGAGKAAGEQAVMASCEKHYIFRASWLYGASGGNFVKAIMRAAQMRDTLSIVNNQFGAPTAAALVADVTTLAVRAHLRDDAPMQSGIYHLCSSGETNWYEYARHIVELMIDAGIAVKATPDRMTPVTAAQYGQPARRPANSRLDTSLLRGALGIELPDWRASVDYFVRRLIEARKVFQ